MSQRRDLLPKLCQLTMLLDALNRFGGLLATGLYRLNGKGHLPGSDESIHGWRWIFIVEGLMTAAIGILAFIVLPSSLDRASFLTEEERRLVVDRLQRDKPSGASAGDADRFSWTQVNRAIFSIQVRAR